MPYANGVAIAKRKFSMFTTKIETMVIMIWEIWNYFAQTAMQKNII